ncbi:hypothetical protein N657DRAFT_635518 [Parathielavia appendiculata]|uniref:Uncharacterized protein n=1 Tax=Parathielavia appendiculata TaxID=2587402 RepID=A0AAN6TVD3_9PEZI|nr:hypothetical protein N657DRAFT_635518 [Parathielavia appendiculata]
MTSITELEGRLGAGLFGFTALETPSIPASSAKAPNGHDGHTTPLLLPSADGLQIDHPSITPPTSPSPSTSQALITITEPPSSAALIPVYPRLFLPSTGKPAEDGCTHTKRVPNRALQGGTSDTPAAVTMTSYVNCKGCTAVTAIPMQHILDRDDAPGPAGRGSTTAAPTASTGTATVYRCLATPTSTASSLPAAHPPPPPPWVVSSRRTRPVQPTLFAA